MRLGFLGTGTIASAVVQGLAGQGHQIRVSVRSRALSATLADRYVDVTAAENQQVVDQSDVLFLGLMADNAPLILADLRFRQGQKVVSFMAGCDLAAVAAMVAPATAAAVVIPFPAIAIGGSPILALGDIGLVRQLFSPRDTVFALSDPTELSAYLCAQAVLSPVARLVADAAQWLAGRVDDPAQAETFLRLLVSSSLTGSRSPDLIEALNTPGGYNQRLRRHMEDLGLSSDLIAGLDALDKG